MSIRHPFSPEAPVRRTFPTLETLMQPTAYRIIREEHRTLVAVIDALESVLKELRRVGAEPDFRLFRSMVYYMDAYPEKLHHPKEESQLFARLRQRTSEADEVLAELGREHAAGAELIHDLEQALHVYEQDAPSGRERFEKEVARYA